MFFAATVLAAISTVWPKGIQLALSARHGSGSFKEPHVARWTVIDATTIAILVVFAGARVGVGRDWISYSYFYDALDPGSAWAAQVGESPMEPGFTVLSLMLKLGFENKQAYFTTLSAITIASVYAAVKRFGSNLWLTIFLYLSLGSYLLQFNATREALAVSLCFLAASLRDARRGVRWLLLGIAVSMHLSALVFVAVFYVARLSRGRPGRSILWPASLVMLVGLLLSQPLLQSWLVSARPGYRNYFDSAVSRSAGVGYVLITVLDGLFVIFLALNGAMKREPFLFGMCLSGVFALLIGLNSVVVGRMADYFTIFFIVALAEEISRNRYRILLEFLTVLGGAAYLFLYLKSYGDLVPYSSVWG